MRLNILLWFWHWVSHQSFYILQVSHVCCIHVVEVSSVFQGYIIVPLNSGDTCVIKDCSVTLPLSSLTCKHLVRHWLVNTISYMAVIQLNSCSYCICMSFLGCWLVLLIWSFCALYMHWPPQWGAADAEIKVPSGDNTELKCSPFKAWSRSVCRQTCYAYCQRFLPCLFLPFWSIYLHFFQNLSQFFLC